MEEEAVNLCNTPPCNTDIEHLLHIVVYKDVYLHIYTPRELFCGAFFYICTGVNVNSCSMMVIIIILPSSY